MNVSDGVSRNESWKYAPVPHVVRLVANYQDEARNGSRQLQHHSSPPDSRQRYQSAVREEPSALQLERHPRPLRGFQIVNRRKTHRQTPQSRQAVQS
jgi:hypothetical protein